MLSPGKPLRYGDSREDSSTVLGAPGASPPQAFNPQEHRRHGGAQTGGSDKRPVLIPAAGVPALSQVRAELGTPLLSG